MGGGFDSAKAAGLITVGALVVLIALHKGINGAHISVG